MKRARVMRCTMMVLVMSILPFLGFCQDPSCQYVVTIKNVEDSLYTYYIILEDDNHQRQALDSIVSNLKRGWDNWQNVQAALLEPEHNRKALIGTFGGYCYPNGEKDQLRIVIARESKKNGNIELMYSYAPVKPFVTEVEIDNFHPGKRGNEIYEYREGYGDDAPQDYDFITYRALHKRIIYLK